MKLSRTSSPLKLKNTLCFHCQAEEEEAIKTENKQRKLRAEGMRQNYIKQNFCQPFNGGVSQWKKEKNVVRYINLFHPLCHLLLHFIVGLFYS